MDTRSSSCSLKRAFALVLLLSLLASCSINVKEAAEPNQGPLGISTEDFRESYLIPPEIPSTLLTYIIDRTPRGIELTSMKVLNQSASRWQIALSYERPPDSLEQIVREFISDGQRWRER